jgi:TRAP-type C4-dicarboxylate transport system permease small subunit
MTPNPVLQRLNRIEEILIATLMAAATLVIFVSVLHRYGLSHLGGLVGWTRDNGYSGLSESLRALYFTLLSVRLTWAQELCIFLFVWMAKFGAAYGVRTGIHVGVDILVNRLPPHLRRATVLFGLLCGAVFTAFVGWLGTRLVVHLFQSGQVSAVLEAPMWLVYLCLPLGSFLMCFRFLEVAANFWKTGELPHHDPTAGLMSDTPPDGSRP